MGLSESAFVRAPVTYLFALACLWSELKVVRIGTSWRSVYSMSRR